MRLPALMYIVSLTVGVVWCGRAWLPAEEVNTTPLSLRPEVAFPNLGWSGWSPQTEGGLIVPFRPILLTHAGDGSNRVFVPAQQGVIYVFPNRQEAETAQVFLDISLSVPYDDKTNEEGFLGMAFHPKYRENGQFFVFQTTKDRPHQSIVVRYNVSAADPNRADPGSAVEIIRWKKPYWNHDGGTIVFGPDGYLYIAIGDGGLRDDPHGNGQNLNTWLGKILRIDVDRRDQGKNYAIPRDNPFVGRRGAKPEIWAYGLRNVWRMAFDCETRILWAGDVGQDTWEEIDLIVKGGNYGWRLREGLHPFGPKGSPARPELIDPIWEYHHDIGKSITGGCVYRGKRLPELVGAYLYADYVTGKIWALRYDPASKRVTANQPIPSPLIPVMSFGEDEEGEVYFMTYSPTGQGLYRFARGETAESTGQ